MKEGFSKEGRITILQTTNLIQQLKKKKVHSCLISQGNTLIEEYYKEPANAYELYKINSVTKSIMAMLIGIAIEKGYIPHINVPLLQFFPSLSEQKQHLTLYHLLTMTTGEKWEEFNEQRMTFPSYLVRSKNWTHYILKRPIIHPPGTKMNYNSGSSHLLSAILQQATGMSTKEFADIYLFHPLGITHYEWEQDPQGVYIGGFNMKLKTRDMLKLGQLFLDNGFWEDKPIISPEWIVKCTVPHFTTYEHIGSYGFHWWVREKTSFNVPYDMYFAMGYGGQYIIVIPELRLTAAISSHMPRSGLVPFKMFLEQFT